MGQLLTVEKLREKVTNRHLLPVLEKILRATEGLSKPGRVDLSPRETSKFIAECSQYHPQAIKAIKGLLGTFFTTKESDDAAAAFRDNVRMDIVISDTPPYHIELKKE